MKRMYRPSNENKKVEKVETSNFMCYKKKYCDITPLIYPFARFSSANGLNRPITKLEFQKKNAF